MTTPETTEERPIDPDALPGRGVLKGLFGDMLPEDLIRGVRDAMSDALESSEYTPRDEVADAIAAVLWKCESNCVSHGEKSLLAADAAMTAARPHILAENELPTVPEGWQLTHIIWNDEHQEWDAAIDRQVPDSGNHQIAYGAHPTDPWKALRAACDASKEADAA